MYPLPHMPDKLKKATPKECLTGWEKQVMYGCLALIAENGLEIIFMQCDFDYIPPVWPEKPGKQ